jgi:coproporphyrinogen III oxidase
MREKLWVKKQNRKEYHTLRLHIRSPEEPSSTVELLFMLIAQPPKETQYFTGGAYKGPVYLYTHFATLHSRPNRYNAW